MRRLATGLGKLIIHPVVFAASPVLVLYSSGRGQVAAYEALETLGITVGLVLLLWLGAWLALRERRKAAILVSAFCLLFFSYGSVMAVLTGILEGVWAPDRAALVVESRWVRLGTVAVWSVISIGMCYVAIKSRASLTRMTGILNLAAAALVVMAGARLAVGATKDRYVFAASDFEKRWQAQTASGHETAVPGPLPDIYYIIVDAYGRADILEEVYGFDNSEFLAFLAERGFYVADESTTNYPQTSLSLASSLNLEYLDDLTLSIGAESDNRHPLHVMIASNKLFQHLRRRGYSILAFASGYGPTNLRQADIYMTPFTAWDISELHEALYGFTPLSAFPQPIGGVRRTRIAYAFEHMADATGIDGPVFVFAHILAPHAPFVFDAEGQPIDPPRGPEDYEVDEYVEGYRGQVVFTNKRLQTAIVDILERSSDAPIIVVQADHGQDVPMDASRVEGRYLPQRMSILNAYYFPDQDYGALHESITPVNTFRVILSQYLGADYPLLEDRNYWASYSRPYSFADVTGDVASVD